MYPSPFFGRRWAAVASAGGVILFAVVANMPIGWSDWAATYEPVHADHAQADPIDDDVLLMHP